ncbi:MAG: hypothetical protein LUO89_08230 [Methanothrix sp.]|nr:hypothetical protein [Methanothrix sp.]
MLSESKHGRAAQGLPFGEFGFLIFMGSISFDHSSGESYEMEFSKGAYMEASKGGYRTPLEAIILLLPIKLGYSIG